MKFSKSKLKRTQTHKHIIIEYHQPLWNCLSLKLGILFKHPMKDILCINLGIDSPFFPCNGILNNDDHPIFIRLIDQCHWKCIELLSASNSRIVSMCSNCLLIETPAYTGTLHQLTKVLKMGFLLDKKWILSNDSKWWNWLNSPIPFIACLTHRVVLNQ